MQAGNLASSDVMAYTSRVLINGVDRPVSSWSVDRELSGDLPAQIVAVSGVTQATGSIDFDSDQDITEQGTNPWNRSTGWLPRKGDRVEIYAGDGATLWKQFHGVIDTPSGSIAGGFKASLIDDYDKLSTTFSHDAMLRIMSPRETAGNYRGVGLSSHYYVTSALRTAGFYATPRNEANCALSVTAQGSMWSDAGGAYGTVLEGGAFEDGSHLLNNIAPWGFAASDFDVTYKPRLSYNSSAAVQITIMVAPDHTGQATIDVFYGASLVRFYVASDRRVSVQPPSGTNANLAWSQMLGSTIVTALIKDGVITIKNDQGYTAAGTAVIPSAPMSSIRIYGDSSVRVAGIQVSHPMTTAQEFASLSFKASAVIDTSSTMHNGIMDAGRVIENQRVDDLLNEIGNATLSGMWIDETGVFRWSPSLALRSRTPSLTVSTLDHILSLDWEDSLLGSRSKVTVKGIIPAIDRGRWCNRVVYRGGGELKSGELQEQFISPESDMDWGQVDDTLTILGSSTWAGYNPNDKSVAGVFYSANGVTTSPTGLTTAITMSKVGLNTFKIRHEAGTLPTDVTANLATSPTDTALWPRNRDKELPRINAFWKVQWSDVEVVPTGVGGAGPELVHDCGWWNNRSESNLILERIADYLVAQTANPKPTITGLSITPDPRLQLGDVITISSPDLMGVTMTALIVGVSSSFGSSYEQSLTVRIIDATTTFTTYAEYDKSLSGSLSYAQWQALGPLPQTYTQFNNS